MTEAVTPGLAAPCTAKGDRGVLNPVLGDKNSALEGAAERVYAHSGSLSFLLLSSTVGLILSHSCSNYLQSSASRYFAQGNEQKQQIWSHQSWEQAVVAVALCRTRVFRCVSSIVPGMLILNRIDIKIDQRLLNTSGKPEEENSHWRCRSEQGAGEGADTLCESQPALPCARRRGCAGLGTGARQGSHRCCLAWRCLRDGRGAEPLPRSAAECS